MIIVTSRNGVPVRLTDERWQHISHRHPEMETMKDQVLETVSKPDMIQTGDFGELLTVRLYPQTPLTRKYLVVAYREVDALDGYILTAYLTRRPSSRRDVLWKP